MNLKNYTIFILLFYFLLIPLTCFCSEDVKTIIITKEDILNAKPKSPYQVNFNEKNLKAIKIMEKRHFRRTFDNLSDNERIRNLEFELLGKVWEYTPQENRISRLKIASSNVMLSGTALPAIISSRRNAKRMSNDSIQMRKKENVGLIDGFLKLISPEKYEEYLKYSEDMYYKYEY